MAEKTTKRATTTKKTTRRTAVPSEHQEQADFVIGARILLASRNYPPLALFAVPNGSKRNKVTGALLQAEGVVAGVPDVLVPVPVEPYHGLAIEMKRKRGGTVSPAQKKFISMLRGLGYAAEVCRGSTEAILVLKGYLEGKYVPKEEEPEEAPAGE